ncbi:DNA repair protein complementing XP-A cells homolog [Acropora palmata]|uniref:DNA repair protein complementing XP-A cells homolog n=1 Tax=Acropora palmata TaxID=6131 RepID=UPI003DA10443
MAEIKLSDAQKARIERNRQRALTLRNARLSNRPYPVTKSRDSAFAATQDLVASSSSARVIDTGGGFLLDAEDEETLNTAPKNLVEEPAPIIGGDQLHCDECQSEFLTSYIYKHFDVSVCDNCRSEEKHALITKTEAREQFLLKDCDFDRREPPLKFILKKNPHYSRGEMKLYLKSQIVQRSHDIWGGEEGLEEARAEKAEKREVQKQRKFNKKVKELRRAVRTSTWKKDTRGHVHDFPKEGEEGGEVYDEETDTWTKTCKTCGYQLSYEKM